MASNKNYMLNDEFPKRIKNATSTSDGLMSAEDKSRLDELFEFGLLSPATPDKDGILIKEDKAKLDGIEEGANYYIHPDDEITRHVTDDQINMWTNKADAILATNKSNGLMSAEDKIKLDSIEANVTSYIHPDSHPATMIIEDENHRFVTDENISIWNTKTSSVATQTNSGLMSATDKVKLDNFQNYTHPDSHPATMIIEDENHRFVTNEQITYWNAKASTNVVTQTDNGLMSAQDKIKLDNLQNYSHPDDENTRHVTDEEKSIWNAKASTNVATQTDNGLMSAQDKIKLDSIDEVNGNYTHPDSHPATMIIEDENHKFVTNEQISSWNDLIDAVAAIQEKLKTAVFYTE